jgi:2-succinyl-6-hydroxy-2,4-cyclohexadiene-1-carboxylate synthase
VPTSPDGAPTSELHVEVEGDGPRLVLAHGFTQTGRLWGPFGRALGAGRQLVRVDLPGHGGSSDVRADVADSGRLLATAGGDAPFDLLGYSLGARVALQAALARPDAVRRLVLVGGTAGIDDPTARAARRARDDEMADDLERSGDVDGFVRRWLAAPMFAGLVTPAPDERRRNPAAGLASSLRLAGTGTQPPQWDRLSGLPVPTLVLAGAVDVRFAALGARLVAGLPDAVWSLVPGAGHAVHLQQPALAARIVDRFLRSDPD